MKILIAAGGSGGHIFPAIALARTLREKRGDRIDIRFIGSDKSLDRRIFEKEGLSFSLLSANKLPYKISPKFLIFLIKLKLDIIRSFFILLFYRADVVVGFGGYVSFPVLFAASLLGIPKIAHEQNAVAGRANRILFKFSDVIAVSFDRTRNTLGPYAKKAVFTGNPIRTADFKDDRPGAIRRLGLNETKFTILVIGGSQGAHSLNENFIKALSGFEKNIRESLQVIHITGVKDYEWADKAYGDMGDVECRVYSFIDRIEDAYSAADLVITRSGASAIFEIAFFGKPMILVPYPFAMSHQAENALFFADSGAAIVIEEKDLSPEIFKNNIGSLIGDRARMKAMSESAKRLSVPDASERLADEVLKLGEK